MQVIKTDMLYFVNRIEFFLIFEFVKLCHEQAK